MSQSAPRISVAPFLPVSRSVVSYWPWGEGHPVCMSTKATHGARQTDVCCFMCSGMHMDAQVQQLDRGRRPAKRASLLREWGKGHLLAATNSLSSVTFIVVPFISARHYFAPRLKRPRGWQGVTANRCLSKDLYQLQQNSCGRQKLLRRKMGKKNTASVFNFYRKKIRKRFFFYVFFLTFTAMFPPLWFLEPDVSSSLFLATEP